MPVLKLGVRLVVVIGLVAASAMGCGSAKSVEAAARFPTGLLDDAERLIVRAQQVSRTPRLGTPVITHVDDVLKSIDDVTVRVEQAPPDPALSAALEQLVATRAQIVDFGSALTRANRNGAAIGRDVKEVAARSARDPELRNELDVPGQQILRDAICDAAWTALEPPEQTEIKDSGWGRYASDVVAPVGEQVLALAKAFERRFGPAYAGAVAWGEYANGLAEKAGQFETELAQRVETPNGTRTQAYVQYIRLCLVPPR